MGGRVLVVKAWALALLLPALLLGSTPVIDRPVVDERGVLSSADKEAVASELVRLRDETGAQMAVLLVGTTGGEWSSPTRRSSGS